MLDKKYKPLEKQEQWIEYWKKNGIYDFDPEKARKDISKVYSIDTPPPTVNGNIHIGHIFSYTQTEMMARYKRLRGHHVFYPFGFDDNGLPTERLVEKEEGKKAHEIGREEFSKLCYKTTDKYEDEFKKLFTTMGVSSDWNYAYKTVSPDTIRVSQLSFLDLVEKGHAYHKESPALWCNECLTSIAQAELETKTVSTLFNYVNFATEDGETFTIATTRPELLPAIVAVFVNPEDEKNKHLIGKKAVIPVVDRVVEILADEKVEKEKGSGIVMCCTFGDQTDIEWWRKYKLELRNIFTKDGRIEESVPKYSGLYIKKARAKILEDLEEAGVLVKQDELEHEVQVHERCGKEVEYSVMNQWFIDTTSQKEKFLEMGEKINWYPKYMKTRFVEWVENVMWDWCISRQRYFGVPFPVWNCTKCGEKVFARKEDLPVNPLTDKAPVEKCVCGHGELEGEKDVMDTWATSAVTPLVNMKYAAENSMEDILKPMSIRTNASDIIRTWDFYSIVKSYYHFGMIPWKDLVVSGFVMAGKGEKISKSKGNAKVDPRELVQKYPADAIRYWAGTGRLGTDIIYSEETLLRGNKLINKLWNVAKFMEMHFADYKEQEEKYGKELEDYENLEYIDKWILARYVEMEKQFIKNLEEYEIGIALNTLEKFFWHLCDNYIEMVKFRLYRPEDFGEKERHSGQKTAYLLLFKLLQNFSMYLPYVTEEIYNVMYMEDKKIPSIHITEIEEISLPESSEKYLEMGEQIVEIISELRTVKAQNNVSLKTPFEIVKIEVTKQVKQAILEAVKDFKETVTIQELELIEVEKIVRQEDEETEKEKQYKIIESKLIIEE